MLSFCYHFSGIFLLQFHPFSIFVENVTHSKKDVFFVSEENVGILGISAKFGKVFGKYVSIYIKHITSIVANNVNIPRTHHSILSVSWKLCILASAYLCILDSLLPLSFFPPPSPYFCILTSRPSSLYSYRPLLIFLLYPLFFFLCALSSLSLFFHSHPLHLFVFSLPLLIFEFSPPSFYLVFCPLSPYLCIVSSFPISVFLPPSPDLSILASLSLSFYSHLPGWKRIN